MSSARWACRCAPGRRPGTRGTRRHHPSRQRLLGSSPDDGAVGERIREGSRSRRRRRHLPRRPPRGRGLAPSHEVDDERLPCARGPGRGHVHHGRRGRRGPPPPPRSATRASAWRRLERGDDLGLREPAEASSASSSVAVTYCARPESRSSACSGRRRDSRAPRRSSAHPRSDRPRRQAGPSERREDAGGHPRLAAPAASRHEAHVRVVDEGGEEADGVRAAADARHHGYGSRPSAARNCWRASWPITACSSRTMVGYGCGPTQEPMR